MRQCIGMIHDVVEYMMQHVVQILTFPLKMKNYKLETELEHFALGIRDKATSISARHYFLASCDSEDKVLWG